MKIITGQGPKAKGRTFQNDTVTSILVTFRNLSENDVLSRSMGDQGLDIILSDAARAVLPLAMELKRVNRLENLDLKGAMQQAKANCPPDLIPVVIYREDRHDTQATLQIMGLMRLLGVNVSDNFRPEIMLTMKWADLLALLGGVKDGH